MAKITNVTIKNQSIIVLEEDAKAKDEIDLREINNIDSSFLKNVIEDAKKNEFSELLKKQEKELSEKYKLELSKAQVEEQKKQLDSINELNKQIEALKSSLEKKDLEKELSVSNASNKVKEAKDKEIAELKSELSKREEEVEYYKNFKLSLGTKEIGESLEKYCEDKYNEQGRMAFPNAYFEKDNDSKGGTKGDFIFRESLNGVEVLSIMFEMKNEADDSKNKHKNENFFDKLDKDRKDKKCEYAVLVSTLESDSNYYNQGIVDVSYRYPKMYVCRPQNFITIIHLLRNANMNALGYKYELEKLRNEDLDVKEFEDKLLDFQAKFSKNYESAKNRFEDAINEIDKTIDHLNKVKENLTKSSEQLRLANTKAQDLSIKKLTKDNPTMKEKFGKE